MMNNKGIVKGRVNGFCIKFQCLMVLVKEQNIHSKLNCVGSFTQ